jgi:hypothetical protein
MSRSRRQIRHRELGLKKVQDGVSSGSGQGVTTVGVPVEKRFHLSVATEKRIPYSRAAQRCAHGEIATGEAFAQAKKIGQKRMIVMDSFVLDREHASGASHPNGDFISDPKNPKFST